MEDLVRVLGFGATLTVIACSSSQSPTSEGASGHSAANGSGGGQTTLGGSGGDSPTAGSATGGATIGSVGGSSASAGGGVSGLSSGGGAGASASLGGAGTPGSATACPADATFCSGFEVSSLPAGAVYKANAAPGDWSRDFAVDSSVFHSGASSLRVKSDTEGGVSGAYRMLAVPAPNGAFWVRFYMEQTELDIGGTDHNVFAGASISDDSNAAMVEFAEDVGLAFNTSDVVRWPMNYGRTSAGGENPFTLSKGTWHCVEISYDSQVREQKLFVDGAPEIDASDYPAASSISGPFKIFKFGFNQLHGPTRKVWYDDLVVAPTRIGCP